MPGERMLRACCLVLLALLPAAPARADAPADAEPAAPLPPPRSRAEHLERARRAVETLPDEPAPAVLIENATVMTAAGTTHAPGWILLRDGKIEALGPGDAPPAPGAVRIDGTDRTVTPGLIDTHSHLGVYASPGGDAHSDGNEAVAPVTAGVWAEHSTWPGDAGFQRALAGGITALQILPGSANLIGGRGVVLLPVPGRGSRAMRFPGAPETVKMACGENPKRVYGERGGPQTRMGNVLGQRAAFLKAQRYLDGWRRWERKQTEAAEPSRGRKKKKVDAPSDDEAPPEIDPKLETLAGVLAGEVLVQVHCYREDDMISFLQMAEEFGFHIRSFHHALAAYKIRDLLAAAGTASSTWADWWGFKLEAYDGIPENAALLTEAGARAIIHSDSAIGIQRLNQEASKAMWAGRHAGIEVSEDDALRWITANPAWALGVDGATGTLEAGKRADVVLWSASPFSVYSRAERVFVGGVLRYDHRDPAARSDLELGREVGR